MQQSDFFARQLRIMFIDGHEIELVSRGAQHTQIWVHIEGRIYADNVEPKMMQHWRTQAAAFHCYCHGMLKAGLEPDITDPI